MIRLHAISQKAGIALSALALAGMSLSPSMALAAESGSAPVAPSEKIETVNVTTSADGTVQDVEIDTLLKNDAGAARLVDQTSLTGVEADDEVEFEQSGNSIVWDADGDSVNYSGKSSAELPIEIKVTYTLNGKQVAAKDLAGASGKVVIRYDYENKSATQAQVNGSATDVVTPFTCVTAIMLDGESFKNVSVTNGKTVDDGTDIIVIGYAMPGLKGSLGKMAEDADIPEYVEVSADVQDFELKSTMTLVTAGLMSDFDTEDFDYDEMSDSADELSGAMSQLVDGSNTLSDGMDELAQGAGKLNEGAAGVASGAGQLAAGLKELHAGLEVAETEAKAGVENAKGQLDKIAGMANEVQKLATTLSEISNMVSYEKAQQVLSDSEFTKLSPENQETIKLLVNQSWAISNASEEFNKNVSGLSDISDAVKAFKEQLDKLPAGYEEAAKVSQQLLDGAEALASGANELSSGTSQLSSGISSAADGSDKLTEGLTAFNDEGITKITDLVKNDLGGLRDRVNALSANARAYDNFGGKAEGTASSVKFVYETEAITAD